MATQVETSDRKLTYVPCHYFITGSAPHRREVQCRLGNRTRHYETLHGGGALQFTGLCKTQPSVGGGDKKKMKYCFHLFQVHKKKVLFSVDEYELKSITLRMCFPTGIKS
jgi:hypothetical protein